MPSPFPGMDPYLEHPWFFPGLHDQLIVSICSHLQPRLPEPYYAAISDRIWIEVARRHLEPDVNVLRPFPPDDSDDAAGGVALAHAVHAKVVVVHAPYITDMDDESRDIFVDIFTRVGDEEKLVTTIEVLSPTNKTPGEHGRDLYLRKQREVLESKTHFVEIDLLRGGTHSTSVPKEQLLAQTGAFDYHVCIHHFDDRDHFFVYPIQLAERLPAVAIPLSPGEEPVLLDLQSVLDRCYDEGPYRRRVRYAEVTPEPPLAAEQQAWANQILMETALLPPAPPAAQNQR